MKLSADSSKIQRAISLHSALLYCRTRALEYSRVKQFSVQNALILMNEIRKFNTKTLSLAEKLLDLQIAALVYRLYVGSTTL